MAKSLNYHDVTIKEEMTDGPTIKEEMTDEPTIKEEMTDEPTIKEEITDESESSCSLISCGVTIKEEIKEETESNSLTLDIKEEDNQQIYYDGLVHVKQDEDVIVPDEAATIIIKEEEGSPIYLETIPLPGQIIIKQENEDDYDGGGNVSNKESDFEEEQGDELTSSGVKKCEIWIVENSSTVDNNKNCSTRKGGLIQVKREKEILVLDEGVKNPIKMEKISLDSMKADMNNYWKKDVMVYNERKPHRCPHCYYRAKEIRILKIHILAHHTGEKPYQFFYCQH
ncbi:probable inactive protein kinase DDB_G0270444 isoform X9 [Halyomorpha halys]|uniref:probable inactive protein kinase DDB_G0270444 isoform X9 n=1 Tax=Halyomorpha halys TaxID=286706 RepID=UPI0034D236AF